MYGVNWRLIFTLILSRSWRRKNTQSCGTIDNWLSYRRETISSGAEFTFSVYQSKCAKGSYRKEVIEVCSLKTDKGEPGNTFIGDRNFDCIVTAGDDIGNEHMFRVPPPTAATIKVGNGKTMVRYTFESHRSVLKLLAEICSI